MKILMIGFNMVDQGTYLRMYEFARCLVSQRHKVTVMTVSTYRKFGLRSRYENGIEIVETPDLLPGSLRSGWDPVNIMCRLRWIKPQEFDLVHSFETRPTCIYPALYLHQRGVPMVLDWSDWLGRGGSVEQRPNPLVRMLLRPLETYFENHYRTHAIASSVICTTLYDRSLALGVDSERLSLIPNGFDLPNWRTYSKKSARQALGLSKNVFLVGYIGSLFPGDARLMSRAFSLLNEQLPESRLLHIGRSNYNIPTHPMVIQTGPVDRDTLSQYLAACDICWLPLEDTNANRGRFPLKFTNYLAAGKPVVTTNVGDVAEYVRLEHVGFTCPPTPNELANAVCRLYEDSTVILGCANEAIRLSQDPRYNWLARTTKLLRLYRQVI